MTMWQRARLALDGTHHVCDGKSFYIERFDEVYEFMEPGLAAVFRDGVSWHIHSDGTPAYDQRFTRVFGFYENLAAVNVSASWFHIHSDGSEAYDSRFAWCGNFREARCAVRIHEGGYFHITPDGIRAYSTKWNYVGDFRDGIAVVQSNDGRSTHVNLTGEQIHGQWFYDLDVYHKGYARARDRSGWMHIDRNGIPIYDERFAMVEPFYNQQARVETSNGALLVIDESGQTLVQLRQPRKSDFSQLSDDLVGFWRTQSIAAAVELGLLEVLPASESEISHRYEFDTDRAIRLLRALAEMKITTCSDGVWKLTDKGEYLRANSTLSLAEAAIEYGDYFVDKWKNLPQAVRGDTDWQHQDIFSDISGDPALISRTHRALKSYALHDYAEIPALLPISGTERVIDAGGGFGALAFLLKERFPHLSVTVLDRPEVIQEMATDVGTGVQFKATDIFDSWGIKGDVVFLARVLHDWNDELAVRILRNAREALADGGQLFVVEMLLPDDGYNGGLCDLHVLMSSGGHERTIDEYVHLLDKCDFEFERVIELNTVPSIIVVVTKNIAT